MCKVEEHHGLAQCTKLPKLIVVRLLSMETLVSLDMWVDGCVMLKSIRGCPELQKLIVSRCSELEERAAKYRNIGMFRELVDR